MKLARIGKSAARGLVAGAAGTVALDAVTYLDMVIRGRPSSEVPAKTVERLAERVGVQRLVSGDEPAANRRSGLGALLGYADGLSAGAAYGAVRGIVPKIPWLGGAAALPLLTLVMAKARRRASAQPTGLRGRPATASNSARRARFVNA